MRIVSDLGELRLVPAHFLDQFVPLCLDLCELVRSGLQFFAPRLHLLHLLRQFKAILVLFLKLALRNSQVLRRLLFSFLFVASQILDLRLKLANAHVFLPERLHFLLMLHLVFSLLLSQVFDFFCILFAPRLHRVELAGLRGQLIDSLVFLNKLGSNAAEFVGGDLTATLDQTKLVLLLLNFGRQITGHCRFFLVVLSPHLLDLLFQF